MHVLLVSTFFPYPRNCGKAYVLGGLCDFFARHPRVTRFSYFHIARAAANDPAALSADYVHAPSPRVGEVGGNLAGAWLRGRRPTLQEMFTFSRQARHQLWTFIREQRPDIVMADTIRAAQYVEHRDRPPARYQLYLDDLFSLRYARILDRLKRFPGEGGDVLGNFGSFIPARLRPLAARRRSLQCLLGYERAAVRAREDAVVRRFERSYLISPEEVGVLRRRSGVATVFPLKLLTERSADDSLCNGSSKTFVFLGDLRLPHNRSAVENLIHHGAHLLEKALPGYRVLVVGKSAPPELAAMCAATTNFQLLGFVPDLRSLLLRARGLIAPLLFGSGIKIKCLEALRLGVPVVSSGYGVEGLGLRPEVDYLHADDIPMFVHQMCRLADERDHARLVAAGHAWFTEHYAPEVVWREYEDLLLADAPESPVAPRVEAAA